MGQLINYLKNLEINQRNIKNVFHKLSADFRNLNVNFEDNEEFVSLKNLIEDLDVLCGVLETDNRELNNIEKNAD